MIALIIQQDVKVNTSGNGVVVSGRILFLKALCSGLLRLAPLGVSDSISSGVASRCLRVLWWMVGFWPGRVPAGPWRAGAQGGQPSWRILCDLELSAPPEQCVSQGLPRNRPSMEPKTRLTPLSLLWRSAWSNAKGTCRKFSSSSGIRSFNWFIRDFHFFYPGFENFHGV